MQRIHPHRASLTAAPLWCAVFGLTLFVGCGGDGSTPRKPVTPVGDGGGEGGNDSGSSEAGADGGDAGDGGGDAGDGGGSQELDCPLVQGTEILDLPAALGADPPVTTSISVNTMHVVFAASPCELGSKEGRGLSALTVPSRGEIGDPVDVVNVGNMAETCRQTLSPSVQSADAETFDVFYSTDNTRFFELYSQRLAPDPVDAAPGFQMTSDPAQDDRRNYPLTAAGDFGAGPFVAFAVQYFADDTWGIASMRPKVDFNYAGDRVVVPAAADMQPRALAVSPLLEGGAAGVLAWLDSGTAAPGLHVIPLNAVGEAAGDAVHVEAGIAAGASLDIAARDDGAAVVYTTGAAAGGLQLLLLDADGRPDGDPITLTYPNQRATDVSIAPFLTGYVIAFRSVKQAGGAPTATATVRLMLVDGEAKVAGERDVTEATGSGGQVRVEVANDGRILLAWPDNVAGEARVRVARVECD